MASIIFFLNLLKVTFLKIFIYSTCWDQYSTCWDLPTE